jgi:methionyl-tRNA formyltransferase
VTHPADDEALQRPTSAVERAALTVGFAGTPEFAAHALRALLEAGYTVPLVLTQPDRPAGRGLRLQRSAVAEVAAQHGLPMAQPCGLRIDGRYAEDALRTQALLQSAALDALVVAAYGLILPPWVLELPRLGCLNIHASLLPRWRGAAPIQRAIEAGDKRTGITIMQVDAGLDTGNILLMEALDIAPDETAASLHDRLAMLGARLVVEALDGAVRGTLRPRPQPLEGVTYAHKVEKREAPIDWQDEAVQIERRIRAFDPFPGATFSWSGTEIKCWRAEVVRADGPPGTVLQADARGPLVACARDALRLTVLQRPGGRRLPAREALQSAPIPPGASLDRSADPARRPG